MPGFVGVVGVGGSPPGDAATAACAALRHDVKEQVRTLTVGPLWLAAVGSTGRAPHLHEATSGDVLVVWGELFGEGDARLPWEAMAAYAADPKVAAPGVHALAYWSATKQELSLLTDFVAARPMYYAATTRGLVFASRPGAVVALLPVKPDPNPAAWFDLLAFGAVTGDTTYFRGVAHLPPASCLRAMAPNFRALLSGIAPPPPPLVPADEALDRFLPLIRQAVARAVGSAHKVTVLSSGGMDSRLVWAALARGGREAIGLSFGPRDLPDVIVGRQTCSALGTRHVHLEITPEHIRTLGPEVLKLTDASFPFLHGVGNLLAAREGPETDVVLDGAKGWIDVVQPRAWFWTGQQLVLRQLVYGDPAELVALLTPEAAREFVRHLHSRLAEFSRLAGRGPLQDRLLALDRVARRMYMQASLIKLGQVAAASPLHDLTLNCFVAALPSRLRLNKFFEVRAVCALAPALGELVYTHTGYPLKTLTTPYTVYAQKLRQRLKPLPLCDRGHRLFDDVYSGWIRGELSDWFRDVFATRTELTESLIKREAPEALLDKHVAQGGETEKLARLATLFLWAAQQDQRTFAAASPARQDQGRLTHP
jgi:hypothetical protein